MWEGLNPPLLTWKMEGGATSQGMQVASRFWKRPGDGLALRKERRPANALTLAPRHPCQTSSLQNHQLTCLCCFTSPSLRPFVTARFLSSLQPHGKCKPTQNDIQGVARSPGHREAAASTSRPSFIRCQWYGPHTCMPVWIQELSHRPRPHDKHNRHNMPHSLQSAQTKDSALHSHKQAWTRLGLTWTLFSHFNPNAILHLKNVSLFELWTQGGPVPQAKYLLSLDRGSYEGRHHQEWDSTVFPSPGTADSLKIHFVKEEEWPVPPGMTATRAEKAITSDAMRCQSGGLESRGRKFYKNQWRATQHKEWAEVRNVRHQGQVCDRNFRSWLALTFTIACGHRLRQTRAGQPASHPPQREKGKNSCWGKPNSISRLGMSQNRIHFPLPFLYKHLDHVRRIQMLPFERNYSWEKKKWELRTRLLGDLYRHMKIGLQSILDD